MLHLLKLALAIGIPAAAVWILMHSGSQSLFDASWIGWFAGYLLVVAAPQLIVLLVGAVRSSRNSAVLGGLVLLDAWLVFVEWSIFHSNDIDGVGWLIYLAASPLFAFGGMSLGNALAGLTRRWSQRHPT
jgi:hypothetical protein